MPAKVLERQRVKIVSLVKLYMIKETAATINDKETAMRRTQSD